MNAPASDIAKRIQRQGAQLIFAQPFFGMCFLYMKRVETTAVPTMAVDGVHLFYNPEWSAALSDDELRGVLAHETMHILLRHQLRKAWRDHQKWNYATDYAINRELLDAGFKLPGGLFDPKYAGMTAEEIYDKLPPPDPDPDDGGGCGMGEVMPCPEDGDGSEGSTPDTVAREWQIRAMQAAQQAKKAGKHVPNSVQLLLAELNAPVIDWRETFRRFIGTGLSDDSSWARPSRRLVSSGIYLPSRTRDRLKRVLVFFDTSGSISGDNLRDDASEAKGMLDDAGCESMLWACVDTRVRSYGEVGSGEEVPSIDFAGGGGTDFAEAMEWAAQLPDAQDIACAVFFTDGYTSSWGDPPPFPVLWCGHGDKKGWAKIAAQIPYGEAVYRGE